MDTRQRCRRQAYLQRTTDFCDSAISDDSEPNRTWPNPNRSSFATTCGLRPHWTYSDSLHIRSPLPAAFGRIDPTRVWNGLDQSAGFKIQSSPNGFGLDWIIKSHVQRILDWTGLEVCHFSISYWKTNFYCHKTYKVLEDFWQQRLPTYLFMKKVKWISSGAYRPYRKYRKCGMAGGDVPRGAPSGKNKKNWKEPSRAEGPRGPLD